MLVVVMHNNREYLELLRQLAKAEGISDIAIVDQKKVGTRLIGGTANVTLSKGKSMDAYNKAFVAMVKGEEKTKHFLDMIEGNSDLDMLNFQDKGFVCIVPFKHITDFTLEALNLKKEEEEKMKVVDLLIKERMILDLKAQNKAEAINELGCLLEGAEEVTDLDIFLKDVFERESLSTTGIGNNIAIPHARTDAVTNFVIVFGKSQSGIEFDSIDNKPVNLVFLMGTPNGKGINNYLKILAKLTRFLNKEDLKTLLYEAKTPEDVITAFKQFEEK